MTAKEKQNHKVKSEKELDDEVIYEFGGPIGAFILMVFCPLLMYYIWICIEYNHGALLYPTSLTDIVPFFQRLWAWGLTAAPTIYATKIYLFFNLFQAIIAMTFPGPVVKGLPIPSEGNKALDYLCNGVSCWYFTLLVSAVLHYTGIFPLTDIIDHFGPIMSVAILTGIAVTWITYFAGILLGKQHRMSGNFVYDLFMGSWLNPRILNLDLKIWVEIRIPWVILFYVSLAACIKQYQALGYVTASSLFMLLAHTLYVNACMKGEECIPTTWDIFYEKWGFMLIFWNFAGVPFTYCVSSLYLLKEGPINLPLVYVVPLFVTLLAAYYIWDTANSQKNRFRMKIRGTYIPRNTFPQLPWGTLENPSYIKTESGSLLLTGGWWGYARKIHYTADLVMALSWGLSTGFSVFLPYFYFVFFLAVLYHRVTRDMERCSKKYGKDWEKYCKTVPYIFIPYVY